MKRSDALAPLSRDHHEALFVARGLRRAGEETAAEAVARFREYFERRGDQHFDVEERVLLPVLEQLTDGPGLAARVLEEHGRLRALASETAAGEPSLPALHHLGEALDAHVRFEERELFPVVETELDPDELRRLGERLLASGV